MPRNTSSYALFTGCVYVRAGVCACGCLCVLVFVRAGVGACVEALAYTHRLLYSWGLLCDI